MRSTLCAALMFGIATSTAKAQGDSARALWVEAVSVMQGTDTVEFFSPRTVTLVAGALRDIRQKYPDMKAIHQPGWRNLILSVQDSVGVATLTGVSGDSIVRTGLRELDSLNEQLGVENVKVGRLGRSFLVTVTFADAANIPIVSRRYASLPHIAYASAVLGSDGNRVQLIVKQALLHFVFIAGFGDCPAGCIRHDYFYFTLDTVTKTITSNGRLLNDEYRSDSEQGASADSRDVLSREAQSRWSGGFNASRDRRRVHDSFGATVQDRMNQLNRSAGVRDQNTAARGNPNGSSLRDGRSRGYRSVLASKVRTEAAAGRVVRARQRRCGCVQATKISMRPVK